MSLVKMKALLICGVTFSFIITFFSRRVTSQSITGLEQCISHKKVAGCSIPFNSSFPYRTVFKPACNRHEVCYHCGKRFHWSRNDCDVGFLYDMYYACAIKDVKQRRKRVHRSVSKSTKKSTKRENQMNGRKKINGERGMDIDEKEAENIRKTAARLIQHDTAEIIEELQREKDKREELSESIAERHHSKKEDKGEQMSIKKEEKVSIKKEEKVSIKNEEASEEREETQRNQVKKDTSLDHKTEAKTNEKIKKKTDESEMKKKFKRMNKKASEKAENRLKKVPENQLELISSKYREIEKVLLELKGMVELEEDRLKETHKVETDLHGSTDRKPGGEEHGGSKESKNLENMTKTKQKSKEDKRETKTGGKHKNRHSKTNNHEINKTTSMEIIKNEVKQDKGNKHNELKTKTAEDLKKEASSLEEKKSTFEEKTFFKRCKLAAYLYFIAVRGFGDKYYRKESPKWCEKGCVKANGGLHFKRLRRPRAVN